MTTKTKIKKDDLVWVAGCWGTARVVKYIRKYGVFLLDRQMSVRFHGGEDGVDAFVSYWTFPPESLLKVEGGRDAKS